MCLWREGTFCLKSVWLPAQLAGLGKALLDVPPVDDVPPGVYVAVPFVLAMQKIRMLPDIEDEQGDRIPLRQVLVLFRH